MAKELETDDIELKEYSFTPKEIEVNGTKVIDFTGVEHDKIFLCNKKGILNKARPSWIPELDIKGLREDSFLPVAVHDDSGIYYVQAKKQVGTHEERNATSYHNIKMNEVVRVPDYETTTYRMTLDVLAATVDYYLKWEREHLKAEGVKKTVSLPRSLKHMSVSRYKDMASLLKLCGNYQNESKEIFNTNLRHSSPLYRKQNAIVFTEQYQPFLQNLKDKRLDLNLQKQDYIDAHAKGEDTSYSSSGTLPVLLDEYGVRIKKQNGKPLSGSEIETIRNTVSDVYVYYGNFSDQARKYNLVFSYADNCNQHARKAIGLFIPYYNAIGVSFFKDDGKKNERALNPSCIFSHEMAHLLDSLKGGENHFFFASDKDGTLENKIALKYKQFLRKTIESHNRKFSREKGKQIDLGEYWFRTCECLARSVEQDYALRHGIKIAENGYLPEDIFIKEIQPLVTQLLEENRRHFNLMDFENTKENKLMAKMTRQESIENSKNHVSGGKWCWTHYNDNSGGLRSPDGKDYFSYDWTTFEYKKTTEDEWNSFSGAPDEDSSFEAFKKYAEKYIRDFVDVSENIEFENRCVDQELTKEIFQNILGKEISLEDFEKIVDSEDRKGFELLCSVTYNSAGKLVSSEIYRTDDGYNKIEVSDEELLQNISVKEISAENKVSLDLQKLFEHYKAEGKVFFEDDRETVRTEKGKIRHLVSDGVDYYDFCTKAGYFLCCDGETASVQSHENGVYYLKPENNDESERYVSLSDFEYAISARSIGLNVNREFSNRDFEKECVDEKDSKFRYMLLGRMQTDCDYYLGNGHRNPKFLWALDEQKQIKDMISLYRSFPEHEKPEWLTVEQMNDYALKLTGKSISDFGAELISASGIATNFVLEKLKSAGIEVITDKEEFNRILQREEFLQKMSKGQSPKYLNPEDMRMLKGWGYNTVEDLEQIQTAMILSDIKLNGKKTGLKKAVEILGREKFLGGISRSALHSTSAKESGGNYVEFDSSILFSDRSEDLERLRAAEKESKEHISILNEIERKESYFQFNEEDSRKFIRKVDEWQKDNTNPHKLLVVGKIPPVMKVLGIADKPIEVEQATLDKMVRENPLYPNDRQGHGLSVDDIYAIPDQLADPVMVFKSRTRDDSYVFFTERKDIEDRSILIPLAVNRRMGRIVINEITSMYGRNNEIDYVKSNLDENNLIYLDKERSGKWADKKLEKEKSSNGERYTKLQLLGQRFTDIGTYNLNILTKERLVNFLEGNSRKRPVQKMSVSDGETYGFTYNGKVYLNPDIMNSNTAVHEYTHLWDNYTQRTNPELWQKGKDIFKNTHFWEEVRNDPNYSDIAGDEDLVLSEIHARICGGLAQKVLEHIAERDGVLTKDAVIDWDKECWKYMENVMWFEPNHVFSPENLKEFFSQPMKDFMQGKEITKFLEKSNEQNVAYELSRKPPVQLSEHFEEDLRKYANIWLKQFDDNEPSVHLNWLAVRYANMRDGVSNEEFIERYKRASKVIDEMKDELERQKTAEQIDEYNRKYWGAVEQGDTRYDVSPVTEERLSEIKNLSKELSEYFENGIRPENDRFVIGKTPRVLQETGSEYTDVTVAVSVIKKAVETHGLSEEEILNALTRLATPILVFDYDKAATENKADSKLVLTDVFKDEKPVALAVNTNSTVDINNRGLTVEIQDIRSIHDRTLVAKNGTDLIQKWTNDGLCRYVDDKKISEWSTVARVQFPIELLQSDNSNILTRTALVNMISAEEKKSIKMAETRKMTDDEQLIFEDLNGLEKNEDLILPKFSRVKIYNPEKYGLPKDDKVHVLAQYESGEREDSVFNQLNSKDSALEFKGKVIDWNPISEKFSGTVEQYLEKLEQSKAEEKLKNLTSMPLEFDFSSAEEKKELPFDIINNEAKGRVNIRFNPAKQNPYFSDILKELKANKWKYAPSTRQWYPVNVEGSREFAQRLQEKYSSALNEVSVEKENFSSKEDVSVEKFSELDDIIYFDRNYNEAVDFTEYLNKNILQLKAGVKKVELSEAKTILKALNHENTGFINQRRDRLGLDKDKNLVIVSRENGNVEAKKTDLNGLIRTAKEMAEKTLKESKICLEKYNKKQPIYEQEIKDIFVNLWESCVEQSACVAADMAKVYEKYYRQPELKRSKAVVRPLEEGDKVGKSTVADLFQISNGVYQAALAEEAGDGVLAVQSYFVVDENIASNLRPELIGLMEKHDSRYVIETKRNEPYILKELISKGLMPPRDNDFVQKLDGYIALHPEKYAKLYPITSFNFAMKLKELSEIDNESRNDAFLLGKQLMSMVEEDDKKRVGKWIIEQGGTSEEAMRNLFQGWISGKEMKKNSPEKQLKKDGGYPPRGGL